MSGDDIDDLERVRGLAEFRYLLRRFVQFSEGAATAAGVTPQHHQLLLQVAGAPEGALPTVGWLAERLQLRHNSVVELVRRCEEAGLVERRGNPTNYRHVVLEVSARGAEVLQRLSEAHTRELEELGPGLVEVLGRVVGSRGRGGGFWGGI